MLGVDTMSLIFWLTLLLPVLITGTGIGFGVHKYRQWRKTNYLLAKRDLSQRLLAADEQVCFLEATSNDDAFATKRVGEARLLLNNAFGTYSQAFSTDDYRGVPTKAVSLQITQSLNQVDQHLAAVNTEPGSIERLKVVGADFGRQFAQVAVAGTTRLLEGGISELHRIVNSGLANNGIVEQSVIRTDEYSEKED